MNVHRLKEIAFAALALVILPLSAARADEEWILSWHDEFDGPAVDTSKWRIEDAALVKNHEKQYYAPDDVYIRDGVLVLRSQHRDMGGRAFTSGLVESKNLFSQRYGRFEFRSRLPYGRGIWPANWMLGATIDQVGWPACGEIDVMELLGHDTATIYQTTHWGPPLRSSGTPCKGRDFADTFHIFAVEWEPFEVRYFIDNVLNHRDVSPRFIPDVPAYILLNTAVGGDWPGDPDSTTIFPHYHEIDYVRVYRRPGSYDSLVQLNTVASHGAIRTSPQRQLFTKGSAVTIEAVPDFGFRFAGWTGAHFGTEPFGELVMDTDRIVTASFEIDPASAPLLSRGAVCRASSEESDRTPAGNVTDGDPATRWASAWSDPQWITIDLGEMRNVDIVRLAWETASAREFRVELSRDGADWRTIHESSEGQGGFTHIGNIGATARYVRLLGIRRNTPWGYSLYDFNVYGKASGAGRKAD